MKLWCTNNSSFTSYTPLTPHSDSQSDFPAYVTSHVHYAATYSALPRLNARLLRLAGSGFDPSRFRNAICHALEMQLKVWLVRKLKSRLEMNYIYRVFYTIIRKQVQVRESNANANKHDRKTVCAGELNTW